MKWKKNYFCAAVLAFSVAFIPMVVGAAEDIDAYLTVEESNVLKASDKGLLGIGWEWGDTWGVQKDASGDVLPVTEEFTASLWDRDLEIPLARMAGSSSQDFAWQESLGPVEQRGYWVDGKPLYNGLAEWINSTRSITPDARFIFTVNLQSETKDMQNLVRFLTLMPEDTAAVDGDGVNWAQLRVDLGFAEPIPIEAFELGNETDGSGDWETEDLCVQNAMAYVELCNRAMDAMLSVNPNIRFAAHAKSYPAYNPAQGKLWNQTMIRSIGTKVDYISYHEYYHTGSNFYWVEKDRMDDEIGTFLKEIDESIRPKIIFTEYAIWSDSVGDNQQVPEKLKTTSLQGALTIGEFINRMANRTDVAYANYFALYGTLADMADYGPGPFCIVRPFTNGENYLTGAGELMKTLDEGFGENIVASSMRSTPLKYCGLRSGTESGLQNGRITASAYTTEDGGLNLILVNQYEDVSPTIHLTAEKEYKLEKEVILTADSMWAENTPVTPEGLYRKINLIQDDTVFDSYKMAPQSVVVLNLVPAKANYPAPSYGELEFGGSTDLDGAPAVSGGQLDLRYRIYNNGALSEAENLVLLVLRPGVDFAQLRENFDPSFVAAVAQAEVSCQMAAFHVPMPSDAQSGTYQAVLVSGDVYEAYVFEYEPTFPSETVTAVSAQAVQAEVTVQIGFASSLPQDSPYLVEVTGPYGQTVYQAERKKTGTADNFRFTMPAEAPSGTYTIRVSYQPRTGEKTDAVSAAFPYDAAYQPYYLSGQISRQQNALVFPVYNNTGVDSPEASVIAAIYDAGQSYMLTGTRIVTEGISAGQNQITVPLDGLEAGAVLRLYVWDAETLRPLNTPYELVIEEDAS